MSTLVFVYFPAPITLYPAFKYPTYYTSFGGCTSAPLRISVSRELRVVLEALLQTVIFFVIHWVISLMVSGGGEGGGLLVLRLRLIRIRGPQRGLLL